MHLLGSGWDTLPICLLNLLQILVLRWKLMTDCFPSSSHITFLLWLPHCHTLSCSAIGLLDKLLPPFKINDSLCFPTFTHSLVSLNSSFFFFFYKTQECLVSHCPTGFQPNKQQTVELFSILLSVTRCSSNSHLRLSNVSLLMAGRGGGVCCTIGKTNPIKSCA